MMKVIQVTTGEELIMKDKMQPDLFFVYGAPRGCGLVVELSRYKGGLANQQFASLFIEQGNFIDCLRLKSGDNQEGIDTKDYILRRVYAGSRPKRAMKVDLGESTSCDLEEDI